ncbi:Rha family transcriptional regulator [Chitiniphilus eburneus]|nr:Rha family transcriptional regulator [Chitiniphilus eburneus]
MDLISLSAPRTMSSLEVAALTEKRHDHVLRDTRSMLIGLYGEQGPQTELPGKEVFEALCTRMCWWVDSPKLGNQQIQGVMVSHDARGFVSEIALDYSHCMTLITGYSAKLRKAIVDRWQVLEKQVSQPAALPDFSNPATAARAWAEQYEARALAEKTKAEIGSRREATAMATASAERRRANQLEQELDRSQQYATIKRMEALYRSRHFDWRVLKRVSGKLGLPSIATFDSNYGTVRGYHVDVWREAYGVDIGQLPDAFLSKPSALRHTH